MNWTTPEKPAELAEHRLIQAIISGHFPIDSPLPSERELASQLGVTRPTLREALQRMARDGWVDIQQGKSTRVRDYWQEGNLGVLSAITRQAEHLPEDFVPNLLFVRKLIAPAYTHLSVKKAPQAVADFLSAHASLPDTNKAFAAFDWQLHHQLTILSGNPIFTLILNGFKDLYFPMGCLYFKPKIARASSRLFYKEIYQAALLPDPEEAEKVTERVMGESLLHWAKSTAGLQITELTAAHTKEGA